MRRRLQPIRLRSMARRPGEERRLILSPRARLIAGWLAAAAVFIVIAVVVGILGGNADGTPVAPGSSTASPSAADTIRFGTALDAASGMVADAAETNRFAAGDTFAYSVDQQGVVPAAVYVEVERTGSGTPEVVQSAAEDGFQGLPDGATAIAFAVPAANLLQDFGPGEYRMTIFTDPAGTPIAEGMFVLVEVLPSGSETPTTSP